MKNKFIATFQNQLGYPRPRFVSSDVYGRNVFGEVNVRRCLLAVAADPGKRTMEQNRISYDTAITSRDDFLFAFPKCFHETIEGPGSEIRLIAEQHENSVCTVGNSSEAVLSGLPSRHVTRGKIIPQGTKLPSR